MNSLMHEERFERWLKVSIGLAQFDPFVVNLVQSLGKWMQICVRWMLL